MGEIIKESLNVGIEHHTQSLAVQNQQGADGLMSVPSLDVGKGMRVKPGFEIGRQEAANHLLGHPIANSWNAQRAHLFFILGNVGATKREGLKRSFLQVLHQSQEILLKVGLKHLDADLVNTRFAAVALDGLKGLKQQRQRDTSGKRMSF